MADSIDALETDADASPACRKLTDEERKARKREYMRIRYAADPERYRSSVAKYREANPEKVRSSKAAYVALHPPRESAGYEARREKCRLYAVAYRASRATEIAARSDENRAYQVAYRAANRDALRAKKAAKYAVEKEKVTKCVAERYAADKERFRAKAVAYRAANPGYAKRDYHRSEHTVMARRLRARLACAIRRAKVQKAGPTMSLVGCDTATLRRHLEAAFLPGMTWGNYPEWHIDHIRPICTFDLSDPEQQRVCFHYKNLRPLWSADNLARPRKNWRPDTEIAA